LPDCCVTSGGLSVYGRKPPPAVAGLPAVAVDKGWVLGYPERPPPGGLVELIRPNQPVWLGK